MTPSAWEKLCDDHVPSFIGETDRMRVPGGWIYRSCRWTNMNPEFAMVMAFVPEAVGLVGPEHGGWKAREESTRAQLNEQDEKLVETMRERDLFKRGWEIQNGVGTVPVFVDISGSQDERERVMVGTKVK